MHRQPVVSPALLVLILCIAAGFSPASHAGRLLVMSDGPNAIHTDTSHPKVDPNQAWRVKGDGGITWRVVYADVSSESGFGFDDPVHGANRRAMLEAVLLKLDSILDHTAEMDLLVQPSANNADLEFISSGGSYFDSVNGFDDPDSFTIITTGIDRYPSYFDMLMQVNFGYTFNESLDEPEAGEIDFFSSLLASSMHGLGLLNLTAADGGSTILGGTITRTTYEKFLVNGSGQRLFGPTGNFLGEPGWLIGMAGGVYFRGFATQTHFPLDRIHVYTPDPFNDQISFLKWQPGPLTADATVVQGGAKSSANRRIRSWERAVLADLGYSVIYDESDTRAGDWVMSLE